MDSKRISANSNIKENIKYLINSPEELEKISEQMFETADTQDSGYFTFDDVVTIFNDLVEKLHHRPPTKSEVIQILKLVLNTNDKKITAEEFPLYLKILLQVLLRIVN